MKLMTVSEVSTMLKLSKSKIYDMVSDGMLPSLKIAGSVRISESDLLSFLESCRREGAERMQPRRTLPKLRHLKPRCTDRARKA
ncbi:MAG: helix-turn-helix domain-containing protein [Planctomycetaceae bacterium]|nr:helix-turn-helix domain-containing protein [Planctomycetaceae bacterium]